MIPPKTPSHDSPPVGAATAAVAARTARTGAENFILMAEGVEGLVLERERKFCSEGWGRVEF